MGGLFASGRTKYGGQVRNTVACLLACSHFGALESVEKWSQPRGEATLCRSTRALESRWIVSGRESKGGEGAFRPLPLRAGSCLQLHTTVSPTETWQNVNACMAASPTPAGHGDRILNPLAHMDSRPRGWGSCLPQRPPSVRRGARWPGPHWRLRWAHSAQPPGITQHVNMAKVIYLHLKVQQRSHNHIFQRIETVQILSERLKNAAFKLFGILV
jgi:hypothetical protein